MYLRKKIPDSIYIITLVFLAILLFSVLEISLPYFFLQDDNASYFLPNYTYNWRSIVSNKSIPLVNFHQYLGHDYLGQGQTGVLYLPIYIAIFLSKIIVHNTLATIDILVIAHLIAAAVGMFLLLRKKQISPTISLLAGFMWISFPFLLTTSKGHVHWSYLAVYLPINFLLLENLITKPRFRNIIFLALIKALFFLQGYIQHEAILIQLELLFIVITTITLFLKKDTRTIKRFITPYVTSFLFFTFLIAPLFLPMFATQQASLSRSAQLPIDIFTSYSMNIKHFFHAQIFQFHPQSVAQATSHIFYAGLINFLTLLLLFSKQIRKQLIKNNLLAYIICIPITLVLSTPYIKFLYFLPLFNLFRGPYKYFPFFLFFLTVGVASIANSLIKTRHKTIKFIIYSLLICTIFLNLAVLWSHKTNTFGSPRLHNPPNNYLEHIINKKSGRLLSFHVGNQNETHLYPYMTYNYATLFGYYHFGGYDPIISKINSKLTFGLNHINNFKGDITEKLLDYLSLWSVKYIISRDTTSNKQYLDRFPQLELIYQENNILLYENTAALPFVRYQNPKEKLDFKINTNSIDIYPDNTDTETVTVSIASLPQYQYFIDGKRTDNNKTDNNTVQLTIPPQTKTITIKFVNRHFYAGLIVSIAFWLILFFNRHRIIKFTAPRQVN